MQIFVLRTVLSQKDSDSICNFYRVFAFIRNFYLVGNSGWERLNVNGFNINEESTYSVRCVPSDSPTNGQSQGLSPLGVPYCS